MTKKNTKILRDISESWYEIYSKKMCSIIIVCSSDACKINDDE